ncbi:uncharacterized protein LOC122849808 [Aphidius gifuensis]|uniref:uncharacterized protein LOC122849808 n=1 Tax=Aphidius gifuensis TaxID=684658 RepID=UPI001CDB8A1A|nr:uncharacterized protein LOC122849808 [Aphidius gifuensis]
MDSLQNKKFEIMIQLNRLIEMYKQNDMDFFDCDEASAEEFKQACLMVDGQKKIVEYITIESPKRTDHDIAIKIDESVPKTTKSCNSSVGIETPVIAELSKSQIQDDTNLEQERITFETESLSAHKTCDKNKPRITSVIKSSADTIFKLSNYSIDEVKTTTKRGRGRPKIEKNMRNKANGDPRQVNQLICFVNKTDSQKKMTILSWTVSPKILENVLSRQYFIRSEDIVGQSPESLNDGLVSKALKIGLIKEYFDPKNNHEAFSFLKKLLREKKKRNLFTCGTCEKKLSGESIECEACLSWHHEACAAELLRENHFFCAKCI